jgi:N-glycosylase/DNA lyase
MDCKNSIPVDTHVFQIYVKHYSKGKETKMSSKSYDHIAEYFRERFGEYAGWAHTFLFTSDLLSFQKEVKAKIEEVEAKLEKVEARIEEVAKELQDSKETRKPKKVPAKRKKAGSRSKSRGKKVRK